MRIGMVHQPHFLPWPGYLARCLAVDVFVILDNVKFNRNHYQQRTKFIDRKARLCWLTLPIDRATRSDLISKVRVAPDFSIKKWQGHFYESYRDAPLFEEHWNTATEIMQACHPSLCNVSIGLLDWILSGLSKSLPHAKVEMIRASKMGGTVDRTARLVHICKDQNITHLVMGSFALGSHDIDLLTDSGIYLLKQRFIGPKESFPMPGVMGLHYVLRNGLSRTAKDLASHWKLEPVGFLGPTYSV
jgi:hypothetical protein